MKKGMKKRKLHILPQSAGLCIALLIGLMGEAIFLMLVLALDVLPMQYVAILVGLILAVDIAAIALMSSRKKNTLKRITGLILIVLVMNVLLVGDYYVYSTYDTLEKISKKRATWEIYNVVSLVGGQYNVVEDIEGETVNVLTMDSKQLNEAKERLVTKADVTYNEDPDILSVGHEILDTDGQQHDELILVTNSEYRLIKRNIEGFGDRTQSIYKIKVKKRADDSAKRIDVTEDSFNVLISGMDHWGTIEEEALSDVNMVMTVNPKTKEILLTSIPRDSYVPLHTSGQYDKLTHSGIYGAEETKQTIEDFLGIDINYTFKLNFSMLVDIVNAVGGIDVYNDVDFISHPKGWHYKEGMLHLEGHRALWFARERKSFLEGDMKRNENQQKVLTAILEKATSSKVILSRYTNILNAVEDEMQTDLTAADMKKLVKMQLKDMSGWTIKRVNIVGATGGAPCYSMGNRELSCVFPDEETVAEARKKIHDTMYPVDNTKNKNKPKTDAENSDGSTDSTEDAEDANDSNDSESTEDANESTE